MSNTFALATFGNGVVAIGAGIIASIVADSFGFVAPFMVSLLFLIASMVVISSTWKENYGNQTIEVKETFWNAVSDLRRGSTPFFKSHYFRFENPCIRNCSISL